MIAVSYLISIIALVLDIIVIVKIFQDGKVGLGILAIFCPIFTFIYGWMNATKYGIKNIMLIWTIVIILNIVFSVMFMPHAAPVTSTP